MEDSKNTNQNQSTRPSRKGELNPMWGRKMSQETRNKMSQSHKAYQQRIRQQQTDNGQDRNYVQQPMTMTEFLSNNPQIDIKGYIQSLMMKEDVYRKIIREEIEKYLWKKQQRTISIPL